MKTSKVLGAAAGVPAVLFMYVMTAAAVDVGGAPELRQPAPGSAVPAVQALEIVFELPFTDAQTCSLWTLDISVKPQGGDRIERYLATAEWSPGGRTAGEESGDTAPACLGTKRIRLAPGQWSIRATATHSLGYGRSFSPWASFSVQ